jgi:hypothetical protein
VLDHVEGFAFGPMRTQSLHHVPELIEGLIRDRPPHRRGIDACCVDDRLGLIDQRVCEESSSSINSRSEQVNVLCGSNDPVRGKRESADQGVRRADAAQSRGDFCYLPAESRNRSIVAPIADMQCAMSSTGGQ